MAHTGRSRRRDGRAQPLRRSQAKTHHGRRGRNWGGHPHARQSCPGKETRRKQNAATRHCHRCQRTPTRSCQRLALICFPLAFCLTCDWTYRLLRANSIRIAQTVAMEGQRGKQKRGDIFSNSELAPTGLRAQNWRDGSPTKQRSCPLRYSIPVCPRITRRSSPTRWGTSSRTDRRRRGERLTG